MTSVTHYLETIELDADLRQQLLGPRPDIEGIDTKTLAALKLFDYIALGEDEKVSRDEFYKARWAAGLILQKYRADVPAMLTSKVTAEDLELI